MPPERRESIGKPRWISIDEITVPAERVTAVLTPELEEELYNSIKAQGIKDPLKVMEIEGKYVLIDGYHRLCIAEKLGYKDVPCLLTRGTPEDLLIQNLVFARQRGKSNPAQEADVLRLLVVSRGIPLETASKMLGLSPSYAKKLLRVADLPETIKQRLGQGDIGITQAIYLSFLTDPATQEEITRDIILYGYTAEQTKYRVYQAMGKALRPEDQPYSFTPTGMPVKVLPKCRLCGAELQDKAPYIWLCEQHLELILEFYSEYEKAESSQPEAEP